MGKNRQNNEQKIQEELAWKKYFSGRNFIINALIAFIPTVVFISLLKTWGLPVGMPITGTIIFFSLIYLIGKIRTKEIKIGLTRKRDIMIVILISIVAIFLIPPFLLIPIHLMPSYGVNLAENFVSAGGGIFIGIGTGVIAGPIVSAVAFSGVSGIMTYRMKGAQIMEEFLEIKKEELEARGEKYTREIEERLKAEFYHLARKHGLRETIPEVAIILSLFK